MLAHATLILAINFIHPPMDTANTAVNSLDVVLLNNFNSRRPIVPEVVSSVNNLGGGTEQQEALAPLRHQATSVTQDHEIDLLKQQQLKTTLVPDKFITAPQATVRLQAVPPSQSQRVGIDAETIEFQNSERTRLVAKLNQRWRELQKRPKKEYLSPATTKHQAAIYLDQWRKKVEYVGNSSYPAEAIEQALSDSLILTVEIDRDGSIVSIIINNPSTHKLLNDAAVQFITRAAPFAGFPAEIDTDTDILVITRAFHFHENNAVSSSDVSPSI